VAAERDAGDGDIGPIGVSQIGQVDSDHDQGPGVGLVGAGGAGDITEDLLEGSRLTRPSKRATDHPGAPDLGVVDPEPAGQRDDHPRSHALVRRANPTVG
jgi:hypothetical protein